jgi:hypothetical protein
MGNKSYIFSRTIPLAWEDPANGFFHSFPRLDFLYDLSAHLCLLRWDFSLRPAPIPRVLLYYTHIAQVTNPRIFYSNMPLSLNSILVPTQEKGAALLKFLLLKQLKITYQCTTSKYIYRLQRE